MKTDRCNTYSLSSILRYVLKNWKIILAFVIAGMLIAGLAFVPKYYSAVTFDEDLLRANLSEEEQSQVADALEIKKLIAQTDDYLANSVAMQVDPYNIATLTKNYYVSSGSGASRSICQSYVNYVNSGSVLNELCKAMGWDSDSGYYSELLTSSIIDNNTFLISIYFSDEDTLTNIEKQLDKIVKIFKSDIIKTYGDYSVKCVNSEIAVKSNINLANTQNSIQSRQTSYISQLDKYQTTFAGNYSMNNLYYILAGADEGIDYSSFYINNHGKVASAKLSKPVICLAGSLVGFVLGIAVLFFKILFNRKLSFGVDLKKEFGLPYIGAIENNNEKGLLKKFSSKTTELSGNEGKGLDIQQIADITAVLARKNNISEFFIFSTSLTDYCLGTSKNLTELLKNNGLSASEIVNPVSDSKALEQAAVCGSVLIIEQVGCSLYQDIEKELMLMDTFGIKVLGALSIED